MPVPEGVLRLHVNVPEASPEYGHRLPKLTACIQRGVGTKWSQARAVRSGTATWGVTGELPSGIQMENAGYMLCGRGPSNQGTIRVAMYVDPLKRFIGA